MVFLQSAPEALEKLSPNSHECVARLRAHRPEVVDLSVWFDVHEEQMTDTHTYRSKVPRSKRAGVLILLYEKEGVLRVLLTRRAKTLRTHPGQTALPGGKMDETDRDIVETAVNTPLNNGAHKG